ncbi:MAG: bifunctional folylpolyglutamate synthase/dihydrofolate synthase [Acholeplasmataceae bacterium]|nr:bifunctional folylpolyglutamate synthase/dihydrofolate synthase [Acholeplasmataceae bacterium]
MFKELHDGIQWIESQLKFKPKSDLDRMHRAFDALHLDLSNIKKIHVAGTNGKGSVCSYLTHILMKQGLKVGTYTSPYLLVFNERIKLNFENIKDDDLLNLINIIYQFNLDFEKSYGETLSFFELMTLMAFIYYEKEKVDVMVIEVGLGGRLDATNILNYDLSLITSIGMDHMKQLGDTLESIASNKLGILKKGNHLITTVKDELHPQFIDHAQTVGATYQLIEMEQIHKISDVPLRFQYQNQTYEVKLIGDHQIKNAILAIEAIHYLYPNISYERIRNGLKEAIWPGRLEEIKPRIYLDAAHNTHAMEALKETFSHAFKNYKITVLFSALGDKDISGMLYLIKAFANKIILTTFPDPRFIPIDPYKNQVDGLISDPILAYQSLSDNLSENEILLITGSLHFIGYMASQIKG